MQDAMRRIESLVGVPWQLYGRTPDDGFDCLTLIDHVYGILGLSFPLPASYREGVISDAEFRAWMNAFEEVMHPGSGVLVSMSSALGEHAGVCISQRRVIHCRRTTGVVINRLAALRPSVTGLFVVKRTQMGGPGA